MNAPPPASLRHAALESTKSPSRYERFAGWLITLLIAVGSAVACLLVIWLTNRVTAAHVPAAVLMDNVKGGGRPDGVLGESLKVDAPEYNDVTTESNAAVEQAQTHESAALIVDAIAFNQADLADEALLDDSDAKGRIGKQDGKGDAWARGDGPGQGDGVPREKRWKIRFDQTSLTTYARQLDFFQIELGAVDAGQVNYASGFTLAAPKRRTAMTGHAESRLFFTWEDDAMRKYDHQLLRKAGVNPSGIVAQFFPANVESMLVQKEQERAGNSGLRTVRRTVFGVRASENGFSFYVIEQAYF
jgi:hypothetical protein